MRRSRTSTNADRIGMSMSRGTIEKIDDKKKMQEVDVRVGRDEQHTKVEHFQPYGLRMHPKRPTKKEKAEAIIVYPGGDRSHAIVLMVGDRRYPMELKEGEVVLYDHSGQKIHLTGNGIVVSTAKSITFNAQKIVLNGEVHLGGEGGKLVHRKDDADSGGDTAVGSATKVYAV